MAVKVSYFHKLDSAVAAIRASGTAWVDRRLVQEAFGVSRWTAWRILRSCGAVDGPGGALVCHTDEFLAGLEKIRETPGCRAEVKRRNRVERYLGVLARVGQAKRLTIARNAEARTMLNSTFGSLPEGVSLTKTCLVIDFTGVADLLAKLAAVVYALHNDLESIRERVDGDD